MKCSSKSKNGDRVLFSFCSCANCIASVHRPQIIMLNQVYIFKRNRILMIFQFCLTVSFFFNNINLYKIEEDVALYQAKLVIPNFTRGKKQLHQLEAEHTRKLASVRIHVEG